ncbi:efflux RND transporter periplasmic adaptor subunit [Candidatus Dependentiae bacterium]|nr:efflux RND transporter periplasmic adaptor subunit [Candidatus Dependentiae bacterium]
MNNKKIIIISSIIILIAGIGFYFYKKNHKDKRPPFKTSKPYKKDLVQYVNAAGTLKAKDEITIGSLVAGRVIKILADDNDFVKKDQVLTILDDGIGYSSVKKFKALLKEAEASLTYYQSFYNRQKQLYKANQISQDLFEQYTKNLEVLKSKVTQTQGDLEIREQEYNNLFIKSPADGVVIAKEVDLGQMITSRLQATVLYKIAKDLHFMETEVDVDEADVGLVQEGQPATFTVDAFPRKRFKANVRQIRYLAKIVDNVVTYATVLDVSNPKLRLRPGMTTNVDIKVREAKNAMCVHNRSLRINSVILEQVAKKLNLGFYRIPGTDSRTEIDHVWIFDGNGFRQIKVKLGVKQGAYTQIISDEINDETQILTMVDEINKENVLLKQVFAKPGTIGSSKK